MVRDGVTIGDHAFLGMMTAVIDNVPDNCTVVGVPGRIVKNN
jgi:serine O-acetyltransferase